LSDVGAKSKKDKGPEDGDGDVETFSRLPNVSKENCVFSDDLLPLVQHLLNSQGSRVQVNFKNDFTGTLDPWNP
jgi:hypothetical protein